MSFLTHDLRHAARLLLQRPAFTIVAVLALGLGIGANTAIFSVVNAVLLRPLPFPEPDRLTVLYERELARDVRDETGAETFEDWQAQARSFTALTAYRYWGFALTGAGEPAEITALRASANLFDLLGVQPALGRGFLPEEEQPGRDRVVVLSHGLWIERFGGDRDVVGRAVALDDVPHTIVGVMPPGFRFPDDGDVGLWAPLAYKSFELRTRNQRMFQVLGRLAPDVTLGQAQAEMDGVAARLADAYPRTNNGWGVAIVPAHEVATASSREPLVILLCAVGFVLLIACANVGNLFLARAADREREMAVRVALGAGRGRIVRQLLAESLLVAALGGAAGLVLALWGVDLVMALEPGHLPTWNVVRVDGTVLWFTSGLALATAVLAGLLPAFATAAHDLHGALKEGGKTTAGARRRRLRHTLVVAEVALAIVLLVGAGLLVRSLREVQSQDPGFRPDGLLAITIYLADNRYPEDHQQAQFFETLLERARRLPGVLAAGAVTTLPMSPMGIDHDMPVRIEGREPVPGDPQADFRIASPGYFETMGIPVLRGREFAAQDRADAPRVGIVNEAFARRYLPGEDPVGQRIWYGGAPGTPIDIVGLVGEVRHRGLDSEPRPELHIPYAQLQYGGMTVVLRTAGDPLALAEPVKREILAIDPGQTITEMRTVSELINGSLAQRRFNTVLLVAFAALALALAGIGIYGVISYTVSQRTQEIGVRMALGALQRDVLRDVVGRGVRLAAVGTLLGLAGALVVGRALRGMLYGVSAADPLTFVGVAAVLLAVAAVACLVPARRAARVDPMVALRYE
jgi:putative ABC transport system permease protein